MKGFFRFVRRGEKPKPEEPLDPLRPFSPYSRKRNLTLPLPTTTSLQRTHSQSQSAFLMKLPPELRLRVYEEVLGSRTLHLEFDYAPLTKDSDDKYHHWWGCEYNDDAHEPWWLGRCRIDKSGIDCKERNPRLKVGIGLLQSCRQVYSESIDILYSKNTFFFSSDEMFRKVPSLLLPQRFRSIASIELVWALFPHEGPLASPSAKVAYDELWEILASMPKLCKLKLVIQAMPCNNPGLEFDEAWFGPMNKLRHLQPESFKIAVPQSFIVGFDQRNIGRHYKLSLVPDIVLYGCNT